MALVRSVWRPEDPRDSPISRPKGLDAPLHRKRSGSRLSAGVPGANLSCAAGDENSFLTAAHLKEPIRCLLLDIEGTTTPIDFVYKVLFPYARTHVQEFLQRQD